MLNGQPIVRPSGDAPGIITHHALNIGANVFWIGTDHRGRSTVEYALIPGELRALDYFKRKLRRFYNGGGGSIKFIERAEFIRLITAHPDRQIDGG